MAEALKPTPRSGVDTGEFDERTRKALQDLSRLRVSLAAILGYAAALRNSDDRDALLDAIEREGGGAVDVIDRLLDSCRLEGTRGSEKKPAAHSNNAYVKWMRSRLDQIETHHREERKPEVQRLASELKESAAARGYVEISEAAGAVQRLSEPQGQGCEAAVEILRRVVNRVLRRSDRNVA